ncbi:MAG TPA: glycosyltransferase N-terminal domain-containing protein, partial [Nitrospira sp.]
MSMWHLLYNVVLVIAAPVILVILLVKRRCRRGLLQRFGFAPPSLRSDSRPLIWVHAVSLGEAVAVAPLVKELHRRHQDHRFVVSTVTETGREAVEQRLAGVAEHVYAPLDFPWVVSRLISQLRPVLYIFVETELWPNLLRDFHQRGIPTAMVNGRLSTRSFARQRWGPVRSFYQTMIKRVSLCLMQSDRDAERIMALGATAHSVRRTGNIKFDQPMPVAANSDSFRARLRLEPGERLFVAGSTHPGEEEALVECYGRLVQSIPSAVLLLAPRHIERVEQVEAMIRTRGMTVQRRSAIDNVHGVAVVRPRVIILD